jgi:hypothetical protein
MNIIKTLFKVILLFIGGLMLLGGGICTFSNLVFISQSSLKGISMLLILLAISLITALAGWKLIGYVKGKPTNKSLPEKIQ